MAEQQLKFSTVLSPERTPELQIPLNRSVETEDKPRLSRQAKAIYELLLSGPVKTSELAAVACQYNARLSEIRHVLVHKGQMVDEIKGIGGQNEYCIVQLGRSTFWQRIKEKGEVWKWL